MQLYCLFLPNITSGLKKKKAITTIINKEKNIAAIETDFFFLGSSVASMTGFGIVKSYNLSILAEALLNFRKS